jgi:hypothetical protein
MDGFIMMKKGPGKASYLYRDPGIPLYALNETLFSDAFAFGHLYKENRDPKNINSIMRPILPRALYLHVYEK